MNISVNKKRPCHLPCYICCSLSTVSSAVKWHFLQQSMIPTPWLSEEPTMSLNINSSSVSISAGRSKFHATRPAFSDTAGVSPHLAWGSFCVLANRKAAGSKSWQSGKPTTRLQVTWCWWRGECWSWPETGFQCLHHWVDIELRR